MCHNYSRFQPCSLVWSRGKPCLRLGHALQACYGRIDKEPYNLCFKHAKIIDLLCRFHRIEVLGALVSVLSTWLVTGILLWEAVDRIRNPVDVNGKCKPCLSAASMCTLVPLEAATPCSMYLKYQIPSCLQMSNCCQSRCIKKSFWIDAQCLVCLKPLMD